MTAKIKRIVALFMVVIMIPGLLSGCWDNRELDHLFIVTGIALDATEDTDEVNVTVQIGNEKKQEASMGESSQGGTSTIILNTVSDTIMGALREFNRDSNHKLLMQHNQIRLFSMKLAEGGIKKHIDLFLRDQQARLEVPLLLVDGKAADALTAELEQDPMSGMFLSGMLEDLSKISVEYQVRMLDFVSKLLQEGVSPVIPIIKVLSEGDSDRIVMDGMGIFKGDKLIGRLDNEQTIGFLWALGDVKKCNVKVIEGESKAILHVSSLKTKRKVTIDDGDKIKTSLTLEVATSLAELEGFSQMQPKELIEHLQVLAQEEMKKNIEECFQTSQNLKSDIFGISTSIYQRHPKQWKALQGRWDEIYPMIELDVQINLKIAGTGQIVQSLEMEEFMQ